LNYFVEGHGKSYVDGCFGNFEHHLESQSKLRTIRDIGDIAQAARDLDFTSLEYGALPRVERYTLDPPASVLQIQSTYSLRSGGDGKSIRNCGFSDSNLGKVLHPKVKRIQYGDSDTLDRWGAPVARYEDKSPSRNYIALMEKQWKAERPASNAPAPASRSATAVPALATAIAISLPKGKRGLEQAAKLALTKNQVVVYNGPSGWVTGCLRGEMGDEEVRAEVARWKRASVVPNIGKDHKWAWLEYCDGVGVALTAVEVAVMAELSARREVYFLPSSGRSTSTALTHAGIQLDRGFAQSDLDWAKCDDCGIWRVVSETMARAVGGDDVRFACSMLAPQAGCELKVTPAEARYLPVRDMRAGRKCKVQK
jgi:hypothetical protein